jgi:hypothetical protein
MATAYRSLAAKEYMYIFISLELQELYMVPFLLRQKRLKEVTRLLLISPRWVNCSGDLYPHY